MSVFDRIFPNRNKVQSRNAIPATNKQETTVRVIGSKAFTCVSSPSEALKSSVVYRGIAILSDSVASIPLKIYHQDKEGHFIEDIKHPLYKLLTISPSIRYTSYEFLENIIVHLLIYGNAYIYIKKDANYDVEGLILLYPNTVMYDEYRNVYNVSDEYNKIVGEFTQSKIIHIRHRGLGTYFGQSVLTYAGRTIGLSNETDKEALSTMQRGGKFRGLISSESSLMGFSAATDNQVDIIADNLQSQIDSGRDILTLQSGATWSPMSQSIRDLQLVDLHQITLSDLARFFGISPAKLGISQGTNYQASLQDSLNFYVDTLNPLLTKIEKAFNKYLIPFSVNLKYKIEFDRTILPYYKEILVNYEKMMTMGLASVNDVRKKMNLPATEGGDFVFITTNAQRLDAPIVTANNETNNQPQENLSEGKETLEEDKPATKKRSAKKKSE